MGGGWFSVSAGKKPARTGGANGAHTGRHVHFPKRTGLPVDPQFHVRIEQQNMREKERDQTLERGVDASELDGWIVLVSHLPANNK